jgi:RNA polymerase sigma-70 factor (ECF subfamily)
MQAQASLAGAGDVANVETLLNMASRTCPSTTRSGSSARADPDRFGSTSWTAIAHARRADSPEAREALARLCAAYWPPVRAYLRRLGRTEHDANDLTQEFFWLVLNQNLFGAADRRKGKFRSFLLTALRHFLTDEKRRANAAKRGGGQVVVSLDERDDQGQPLYEPASDLTPVKLYERKWALTVFHQALDRLREEYQAGGRAALFEALKGFLEDPTAQGSYGPIAARLGMTANAVGVAVRRLRHRFGEILRAEITRTLADPSEQEIEAELRHLFGALSL